MHGLLAFEVQEMRKLDYAIVFVSDMAREVAFYRNTLGLPLKFESPHWTEFANAGLHHRLASGRC